jgi:hypothetical protein
MIRMIHIAFRFFIYIKPFKQACKIETAADYHLQLFGNNLICIEILLLLCRQFVGTLQ